VWFFKKRFHLRFLVTIFKGLHKRDCLHARFGSNEKFDSSLNPFETRSYVEMSQQQMQGGGMQGPSASTLAQMGMVAPQQQQSQAQQSYHPQQASQKVQHLQHMPIRAYLDQTVVPLLLDGESLQQGGMAKVNLQIVQTCCHHFSKHEPFGCNITRNVGIG